MTTAFTVIPFRFFDLHVVRTNRICPSFVRVTFGGEQLAEVTGGGRDQRVKLFFPHPHQEVPVLPADRDGDWFGQWRQLDPGVRAVMRTYTVRAQRPGELDVDFAVHGVGGPASQWAARAGRGSRVALLGPVVTDNGGVDFQPPPTTDWVLLTADETALPAVESILSWLPAGTTARVWIEVASAQDIRSLPSKADAKVTWLVRDTGQHTGMTLGAVRGADLPAGRPYAWIAGEAGAVRELRRLLVGERGFDRDAVTFTGYWRRGAGEDDLIAEHIAATQD